MPKEKTQEILSKVNDELKKAHDETINQVKELLTNGKKETDPAIVTMQNNVDQMKEAIDNIQQQIKSFAGTSVSGAEKEIEQFSISNYCRGVYNSTSPNTKSMSQERAWEGAELEKELTDAYTKEHGARIRANYAGDGSSGAYLLIPEQSDKIIGLIHAAVPLLDKLPVTKLTGIRAGEYRIPKITSGPTAYMVGERQEPTDSSVLYEEIISRERRVAALSLQSKRLMYQSKGVSDMIIRRELVKALSLKMHQMGILGKGAEYEPKGLTKYASDFTSNTINLGTNGGRFNMTDAEIMKMVIASADEGNEAPNNYGFLFRPEVEFGIKTERVIQYSGQTDVARAGMPVSQLYGLLPEAVIKELLGGAGYATTTHLPKTNTKGSGTTLSDVIYGNWEYFWWLFWEGMELRVSDQAYVAGTSTFSQNQIAIIVEQGFDCAVTRETAFTLVNHAETNAANW